MGVTEVGGQRVRVFRLGSLLGRRLVLARRSAEGVGFGSRHGEMVEKVDL